jgi:hypothetical protein
MRGAGMLLKNIALPAVSAYFTGGISLIPYATQKHLNGVMTLKK